VKTQHRTFVYSRRALLLTAFALPFPVWADLTWNSAGPTDSWSTDVGNTNWLPGNVVWAQNDNAIFNGTAETVTVTTANTFNNITFDVGGFIIAAGSGSFNLANDQASTITVTNALDSATIAETIADNIAGLSSLTKAGAGTLILSGANTYTGQTLVTAGTLKPGAAGALGAAGAGAETVVSSGATLDVNGQALTNTEIVRIAGTGVGSLGALVNTGASQQNALNRVELTGNASVGGTQRFDIRPGTSPTLDLGVSGFTLTKVGVNQFSLVGTTVTNGNLTIDAGTLSIETTSTVQGTGTITVNSGAILGLYQNTDANVTRAITVNNGSINNLGSSGGINSNITLSGGGAISTGAGNLTTTFGGNITGSGPLAISGTGAAAFNGTNTYTGGTTITESRLNVLANASAIGAGPVTVNGDGIVNDGQFFAAGAVNFPNTFTISGRGGNSVDTTQRGAIRLDSGASISGGITLAANAAVGSFSGVGTLSGIISGGFELTKVDGGTIALTGNNTHTGGTNVAAGTLRLDFSTSDSSKLPDTGVLTLSGGTLELSGPNNGSTTHTDIVASTSLAAATSSTVTRTAGAGNRIALGTITPGQASFLNVSANSIATTSNVPVAGNLGSWLAVGGTSLATTNGSNEIVAVTYTDIPTGSGIITDGMNQVRITGGAGNVTLGGIAGDVIDANSITRSVAGSATIDTTGKTLRLGSSGVIFSTTGSGGMTIGATNDGGNLTAGGADNTPGVLDFNLVAGDVTVRSTVINNGSGAVSVVKSGGADLILTGNNSYTGGTTIYAGGLRVGNSDSALGTGTLTIARSALLATANGGGARNLANNVVINSGATASLDGGYAPITLSGIVSGGGSLTTASSGSVILSNVANTYTGSSTIGGNNTLSITTIKNVGDATGSSLGIPASAATGTIGISNSGRLLYTGTGNTTDRVLNLTGTTANATPTIDQSGTGVLRFDSSLTSSGAASKNLTLQGSTAGTGEFAGVIQNNSATNTTALTKAGSGTWSLLGTNTYTGNTTVNAGVLNLAGTSANATGKIRGTATVNAGGTLRLSVGDATGYGTDATRLSVINLIGGALDVNSTSNQTLGNATINITGGAITGIAGSNIDFFQGSSALNTAASAVVSTISGTALSPLRQGNTTFTVADGTTPSGIDLSISSVIRTSPSGDPASAVLIKAGTGTLELTAANTLGGGGRTIRVDAGSLLINNTTGSGAGTALVTVNSGGTLGGTGSFTGALTVNTGATLAPGASAGTLATGAAIIDGTYACEINGATADKLAVTGNLDIDGATLNVSVLGGGANQAEYIIATYTGTRTGVFTGLAEGATVITGYTITYATAGQIKLVSTGPNYTSWAASFTPNPGAPGAEADGDGFDNGLEFILGGSPVSGSNNPKIYSFGVDSEDGGTDKELIMTIAVPVGTPAFAAGAPATSSFAGFGIAVRGSTTLSSYPVTVTPVAPVITGLPALTPQGGVSYEYRSFSLDGSNGLPSKGFLRVTVTNP
jgi:autotransporter-associated beta strand protein